MEFESFEQALKVCLTAEKGSREQDAALVYCLENAPPEFKKMLEDRFLEFHKGKCGCGCKD